MKVASPSEIGAKVAVAPPHQHNMPGAAASVRGPRPSSTAASVAEPAENAPCGRRRSQCAKHAQIELCDRAPVAVNPSRSEWGRPSGFGHGRARPSYPWGLPSVSTFKRVKYINAVF